MQLTTSTRGRRRGKASQARASGDPYRLLFSQNPLPMWITDSETLAFLAVNEAAVAHYGYSREEFLAMTVKDIRPPEDVSALLDYHAELQKAVLPASGSAGVWRHRKKDGTLIDVDITWSPISFEGRQAYLILAQDVTERRQADEKTRLLQSITTAVSVAEDVRSALGVVMAQVCQATGWALAEAWVPRPDGKRLEWCGASQGSDEGFARFRQVAERSTFAPGEGLPGRAWASKSPLWIGDITTESSFERAPWARETGLKAAVAVPVLADDEVVAVIDFFLSEPREEDKRFVGVVQAIATQLGWLILRRRAEEERRRLLERERAARAEAEAALERLRAIQSVTDAALAHLAMDDLLREMLARIRVILAADVASILLLSEDGTFLSVRATQGLDEEETKGFRVPIGRGITGGIAARREPMIVDDLSKVETLYPSLGEMVRSGMGAPLLVEGQVVGLLGVGTRRPRRFTEEDLGLLQLVADRVAPTIDRIRLLEEARKGRERLEMLSRSLVDLQEAERRRIARELHDEVGQLLTSLQLALEASGRSLAGAPQGGRGGGAGLDDSDQRKQAREQALRSQMEEMKEVVSDLLARVRNLSMNLRPPMLDDLGLLPVLLWHFERYTAQTRVRLDFQHTGVAGRFSPEVETAAFRIVQEALTNVARHAGVDEVKVEVWADAVCLGIRIEDQGRGFDAEAALTGPSIGLAGMAERAHLLGGRLTIDSAPESGTRLLAELPLGGHAGRGASSG